MILGFIGKGGSGKSSLATQMVLHAHAQNKNVLAVDADHNMDISYNLLQGGSIDAEQYLGAALQEVLEHVGVQKDETYADIFLRGCATRFTIEPPDSFTEKYSIKVKERLRLMVAGPQTDTVLYGKSCSHVLTTPLKVYLPLLEPKIDDVVVVDEKAGADGVTTGIVTGLDVGVIVCEPALHSLKTARQIAELMEFYGTPSLFVGNKVSTSEDKDFITEHLGVEPVTYLMESTAVRREPSDQVKEWQDEMATILKHASTLNKNDRLERTRAKFERNKNYQGS
jgi:CO dehydrogenase maturation factor